MDIFSIQLTTLLVLFAGSFLFGILPLICVKFVGQSADSELEWSKKTKVATFLLYFGGGVFISDCFLVLLPKARRDLDHETIFVVEGNDKLTSDSPQASEGHHDGFPIPEFIILCSFFVAYILQEVLYQIFAKISKNRTETRDLRLRFCTCAKRHTECSRTFKDARPDQSLYGMEKKLTESASEHKCVVGPIAGTSEAAITAKSDLLRSSIIAQAIPNYGAVTNVAEPTTDNPLPVLTPPILLDGEQHLVLHQHSQTSNYNTFLISSMLTVLALTLQYVFVGISIGLQATSVNKWPFLAAACLQNFILMFSSGSELVAGNLELSYIIMCISVLSCISPVSIMASMWDSKAVEAISNIAKGTVESVACGTLMYTTFYQMLRQKRPGGVVGLTKFSAIATGTGIMAAMYYAVLVL